MIKKENLYGKMWRSILMRLVRQNYRKLSIGRYLGHHIGNSGKNWDCEKSVGVVYPSCMGRVCGGDIKAVWVGCGCGISQIY